MVLLRHAGSQLWYRGQARTAVHLLDASSIVRKSRISSSQSHWESLGSPEDARTTDGQ